MAMGVEGLGGLHGFAIFTLTHGIALGNEGCACAHVRKVHEGFWKRCVPRPGRMILSPQTPNRSDLNKDFRSFRSEAKTGAWQMRSDVFEAPEYYA